MRVAISRITSKCLMLALIVSGFFSYSTVTAPSAFAEGSCVAKPAGLVSWWPGDFDATDYQDSNPGTPLNGAHFVPGNSNGAFCLDGSNQSVSTTNAVSSGANGTMEAWINPSGTYTGSQVIIAADDSGAQDVNMRYSIIAHHVGVCPGGDWSAIIGNGTSAQYVCSGQVYNATNFPAGVWTYLAITYDGSNVRFYKDGTLIHTVTQTVSGAGNAQPFAIGRAGGCNCAYFSGGIDEARIYNTTLSSTQIASIYNAGRTGMCKFGGPSCSTPPGGLVSWWPLDGHPRDILPKANHGTLHGDATFTASGKVGQAITFDGSGDYISTPDDEDWELQQGTYLTWFKTTANPGSAQMLMDSFTFPSAGGVILAISGSNKLRGDIYATGGSVTDVLSTASVNDGSWHLGAVTWAGGSLKVYLDGSLANSAPYSGTTGYQSGTNTDLILGAETYNGQSTVGNYFNGQMDEPQVFSRALSASEISSIFSAGTAGECKAYFQTLVPVSNMIDTLSREQVGVAADHTIQFTVPGGVEPGGQLGIRFPAGFTIPPALDYTDVDITWGPTTGAENTLTLASPYSGSSWGITTGCNSILISSATGAIPPDSKVIVRIGTNATQGAMGDQQITNPSNVGSYVIDMTSSNGQHSQEVASIVDSDQVGSTGTTSNPSISFDIDTAVSDIETPPPYTIGFGTLSSATLTTSNNTINSIYLDFETNAIHGGAVTVQGANGGLHSVNASHTITLASPETTITAGQEKFGLCVAATTQTTGSFSASANYDADGTSNCTTTNGGTPRVGKVNTNPSIILSSSGPISAGRAQILGKASITDTTPAAPDYRESLTFIATGTF